MYIFLLLFMITSSLYEQQLYKKKKKKRNKVLYIYKVCFWNGIILATRFWKIVYHGTREIQRSVFRTFRARAFSFSSVPANWDKSQLGHAFSYIFSNQTTKVLSRSIFYPQNGNNTHYRKFTTNRSAAIDWCEFEEYRRISWVLIIIQY